MNKDEAREAAIKHAYQEYTYGGELFTGKCSVSRQAFKVIYLAGAASVDRKAIVQEAFEVLKHRMSNRPDVGELPRLAMAKEMDAVLASMGGDDE